MLFKKKPETVAAVDLGSNSFHLTVARIQNGQLHVIDNLKEMVRIASGITSDNNIEEQTATRAIACLERFGQRIKDLHPGNVRAIGTNALRQANQANNFIIAAEKALGYPIDIISGIEEARLIYLGVSQCAADSEQLSLIIDIGGGSTELVIGKDLTPKLQESLYIGCVGMSLHAFPDGKITTKRMQRAIIKARQELAPIEKAYIRMSWARALGSSGTIRSIAENLAALGLETDGITLKALKKLRTKVIEAGHIDQLTLPALSKERAPVFPGGLAILIAIFESLQITRMHVSKCALREGILYELLGTSDQNDIHRKTVKNTCERYQVDIQHASRVATTSIRLFDKVKTLWNIDNKDYHNLLYWSAKLHEIGLAISHSRYHRHGAYLIEHSDLPGFTRQEQVKVATLIRLHRRKIRNENHAIFNNETQQKLLRLTVLLRLAVILHRGRSHEKLVEFDTIINNETLTLVFPAEWLLNHPLTEADLEQEAHYLKEINIDLQYREKDSRN